MPLDYRLLLLLWDLIKKRWCNTAKVRSISQSWDSIESFWQTCKVGFEAFDSLLKFSVLNLTGNVHSSYAWSCLKVIFVVLSGWWGSFLLNLETAGDLINSLLVDTHQSCVINLWGNICRHLNGLLSRLGFAFEAKSLQERWLYGIRLNRWLDIVCKIEWTCILISCWMDHSFWMFIFFDL